MSSQEIKKAWLELELSRSQLAAILGTDMHHVRGLEAETSYTIHVVSTLAMGWLIELPPVLTGQSGVSEKAQAAA